MTTIQILSKLNIQNFVTENNGSLTFKFNGKKYNLHCIDGVYFVKKNGSNVVKPGFKCGFWLELSDVFKILS